MKLIKSRGGQSATAEQPVSESPSEDPDLPLDEESDSHAAELAELTPDGAAAGAGSRGWAKVLVYGVLPVVVVALAAVAGYFQWRVVDMGESHSAKAESVKAATDGTIALLSYKVDTVEKDLEAAKQHMTGTFLDSYSKLTHDIVIPGSKQKKISAVATVPAASSTSATANHAVVLLFVDQTVIVGDSAPTNTASTVRVTLDKIDNRWLISQFDPV